MPEDGWMEGPTEGQVLGVPASPHRYGRKTKTVVRHWLDTKGKPHQDYLVSTLVELSAGRSPSSTTGERGWRRT